jgi:phosphohistidine phosphatase
MKKLIIVRHAKAEQIGESQRDFERALAKRGEKDAPLVAEVLKNKGIRPDIILSSPAKRAKQTALLFAEVVGYSKEQIAFWEEMYGYFNISQLSYMIKESDKNSNTVFIFGHNPTFADLGYRFTEEFNYHLPTSGAIGLELDINNWDELRPSCGKLSFFEYPKKHK